MTTLYRMPSRTTTAITARAAADGLLAQRGHGFHLARRLLSARHAERATRLYGWCRFMHDLADESPARAAALAALAAVRVALQTGQTDDPTTSDILLPMRECGISAAIPLDLIRGIESDLGDVRVADLSELSGYAYRVAGTVGQMMKATLDVATPEAPPHAVDLGIAKQLTNICRDVRDGALSERRYLPATRVGAVEPAALAAPEDVVQPNAAHAMRTLLDVADRHCASGEQGLLHLLSRARRHPAALRRGHDPAGHVPDPLLTRFMDHLFLDVLRSHPERGPELFMRLFGRAPTARIVRFLSDRGTLWDRAAVAAALPAGLFLSQLMRSVPRKMVRTQLT